jgi:hypothetical protein
MSSPAASDPETGRSSRGARRAAITVLACLACALAAVLAAGQASTARATSARRAGTASATSALARLPHASGGLDVLPFPGTPDAPPGTRISFPALSPGAIASLRVRGSRSGAHAGRLLAQAGGPGSVFVPVRPFDGGERVSVTIRLRGASAGTAAAARARLMRFSFTIARAAGNAANSASASASAGSAGWSRTMAAPRARTASSAPLTQSFVSEPTLAPPTVNITGTDTDYAAGDIFLDAQNSSQNGPYILGARGRLLWFAPTPPSQPAFDVRVQTYQHRPVLTYFEGRLLLPEGVGRGVGVMLNESYDRIHTITAGDGYQRLGIDLHELTLTPSGDAFVTLYAPVRANLTSVGGPANGVVLDSIIQEIDVANNHVLWEWSALGHVPVSDSYLRPKAGVPFDYFHINSIQLLPDGELIISGRHTWAVYSINMRSGRINWELGGKHSSFRMGPGTNFEWQHHVRVHGGGLISIFDDASNGPIRSEPQSRALVLRLSSGQAALVHAYEHTPPVLASSQGSVQLLFNHNVFVGWGAAGPFSEYTPSGQQLFSGTFNGQVQSYRAYRFNNWVGDPLAPPSIATRAAGSGKVDVYASWNGATNVAEWRVLAGTSRALMVPAATAAWQNFETEIPVSTTMPYVEVQALDGSGRVLGTSGLAATSGACVGSRC